MAFRILFDPVVRSGRLLGRAEGEGAEEPLSTPASPCPREDILVLDACSLCGGAERTLVGEFNRFVHFARPPDEESLRADYCLCHGCGCVYASRRPAGPRYRWLLEHFEETLHRVEVGQKRGGKIALSSSALSDDDRDHLRVLAARGVFVSEHTHVSRKEYLPTLLADRLAASAHVEIVGSLLDLRGRRVLEVRSRLGSIAAALRRLYGADVAAMAMFEGQRFLINEVYGIPAWEIDFDRFEPPPGPWDLVICNHMMTHAIRPREMLAALRAQLTPGAHVYFYNEPDDAEILVDGKSMFSTLNAFHLQTFDGDAFVRAIAASGFSPVFVSHLEGNLVCLAQATDAASPHMPEEDLRRRRKLYSKARDAALLMLPESARWRVRDEWPSLIDRALKTGVAELGPDGALRVRRERKA